MATAYLGRTQGTPTNSKKWTISYWAKYNFTNGQWYPTFGCDYDIGDSYFGVGSGGQGRNEIGFLEYHTNATNYGQGYTAESLRDSSGWYHIVFAYDSTQGTAADRGKTYINGVQATNTYTTDIPSNHDSRFNMSGSGISIGRRLRGPQYMDAQLAHFHFVDGTAYTPTTFGETDSTTGIWKPKTSPSVTYGNNGFFLKFDNSANMGLDSSGRGNNLTTNGTVIQNKDTPSDNFATWNPLIYRLNGGNSYRPTFSNTNNTQTGISTNLSSIVGSTLCFTQGKWYAEFKYILPNSNTNNRVGIFNTDDWDQSGWIFASSGPGYGYRMEDGNKEYNGTTPSYGNSCTNGDIIGVAFDATNGAIWFSKNGVWQNNATISEIGAGTTTYAAFTSIPSGTWTFTSTTLTDVAFQANFGNGYFGTTAVSSAQNPDDGIGIFEYDVPAGYRALCTKSLNAQEYS